MISISAFTGAAVDIISSVGIDELTVSSVCAESGVTRPTFYSKLGNLEGLLAETWLAYADEFFSTLSSNDFDPNKSFLALAKILAVSHRVPDVWSVTSLPLLDWWGQVSRQQPLESWRIANRLGFGISFPALKFPEDFSVLDQIFANFSSMPPPKLAADVPPTVLRDPSPLSEIQESTIRAINQWGYKNASMARIARDLRVTSGSIYPNYSKIAKLLEDSYSEYQGQISALNIETWSSMSGSPRDYGTYIRGGLTPSRKVWRRLRLETMVSAQSRPTLATKVQESIEEMASSMAPILTSQGANPENALNISYLFHTLGVGFGLLHDVGVPLDDINHEHSAEILGSVLLKASAT